MILLLVCEERVCKPLDVKNKGPINSCFSCILGTVWPPSGGFCFIPCNFCVVCSLLSCRNSFIVTLSILILVLRGGWGTCNKQERINKSNRLSNLIDVLHGYLEQRHVASSWDIIYPKITNLQCCANLRLGLRNDLPKVTP